MKSIQQRMIDSGVNPYIVNFYGYTQFDYNSLFHLTIPEMPKSVYFSIYPDESYPSELQQAWYYSNGVLSGNYEKLIGKGSEGCVVSGEWMGADVAYKFVEIKNQNFQEMIQDSLKDLKRRLTELNSLKSVKGSCILQEYGHFR